MTAPLTHWQGMDLAQLHCLGCAHSEPNKPWPGEPGPFAACCICVRNPAVKAKPVRPYQDNYWTVARRDAAKAQTKKEVEDERRAFEAAAERLRVALGVVAYLRRHCAVCENCGQPATVLWIAPGTPLRMWQCPACNTRPSVQGNWFSCEPFNEIDAWKTQADPDLDGPTRPGGPQDPAQAPPATRHDPGQQTGAGMILAERERQVNVEGWTCLHDDAEPAGALAAAGAAYATGNYELWPWARSWWKPKDRVRDLVRAGALIAAEIDREMRVQRDNPQSEPQTPTKGGPMDPLRFDDLRQANMARCAVFKNARGEFSHPGGVNDWPLSRWGNAVAGEVGEACEWVHCLAVGGETREKARAELARELADVVVYLDLWAARGGIELCAALGALVRGGPSAAPNLGFDAVRLVSKHAIQRAAGTDGHALPRLAVVMAGEIGKACNLVKKIERGDLETALGLVPLAEQLGVALLAVDAVAAYLEIDLGAAVRAKFNEVSRRVGAGIFLVEPAE